MSEPETTAPLCAPPPGTKPRTLHWIWSEGCPGVEPFKFLAKWSGRNWTQGFIYIRVSPEQATAMGYQYLHAFGEDMAHG